MNKITTIVSSYYNANDLSKLCINSFLNDPNSKYDKPNRFGVNGYSIKEAFSGLAENGRYLTKRIVIVNNRLVDGRHLLEAYRTLNIPVPFDKVSYEN